MDILLAEDDPRLGSLIKYMLEKDGMRVEWVTRGDAALDYALYTPYTVLILDWMMPGLDGPGVCGRLRRAGYQGAIMMLTAKDGVDDRVRGLDAGADDYVVKPFEFSELQARLRALARRGAQKLREDVLRLGDIVFDRNGKTVAIGAEVIQLTVREFQIFDLLVQNKGRVITRAVMMDRVWGLESDVTSNNIDAYVRLLRKKLEPAGTALLIYTVRGVGYKLEGPPCSVRLKSS